MADNKYDLKFTLSDGTVIDAGTITAPQGPQGEQGPQGDPASIPYSASTPLTDGVGNAGSANFVARSDHRHPTDTSRQATLVSGTNIKTINGQSLLGSGDIEVSGSSEYANTSEQAYNVLSLSTTSTVNNLAQQIVANKTKVTVQSAGNNANSIALLRLLGNPGNRNTSGSGSSAYISDGFWLFKVFNSETSTVNNCIIQCLFYGISAYDSPVEGFITQHWGAPTNEYYNWLGWQTISNVSSSSKVDFYNPKTERSGTTDYFFNFAGNGSSPHGVLLGDSSDGIVYQVTGSVAGHYLCSGGPTGNVKTLFGNQSIYGSGNIDLYRHVIKITGTATDGYVSTFEVYVNFISSSNTNVDSLTDLYSAMSNFGVYSATGILIRQNEGCPVQYILANSGDGIHYIIPSLNEISGFPWAKAATITITDTVTTV